jgi:hypothetical protein
MRGYSKTDERYNKGNARPLEVFIEPFVLRETVQIVWMGQYLCSNPRSNIPIGL